MPKFLTFRGCFSWICVGSALAAVPSSLRGCLPGEAQGPGGSYLLNGNDLAGGLLDLLEAAKEVPVPGLRDGNVRREDGHAVQGRSGLRLGGQVTPDHLVLLKTTCWRLVSSRPQPTFFPSSISQSQEQERAQVPCSGRRRRARVSNGSTPQGHRKFGDGAPRLRSVHPKAMEPKSLLLKPAHSQKRTLRLCPRLGELACCRRDRGNGCIGRRDGSLGPEKSRGAKGESLPIFEDPLETRSATSRLSCSRKNLLCLLDVWSMSRLGWWWKLSRSGCAQRGWQKAECGIFFCVSPKNFSHRLCGCVKWREVQCRPVHPARATATKKK